jgi:cyclase
MHTRRDFLQQSTAILAGGAMSAALGRSMMAQAPAKLADSMRNGFANAPLTVTRLTDAITVFSGPGGNMAILTGPDGKLMVDDAVPEASARVKAALDAIGPQPLQVVINTHWHWDHTGGNAAMHGYGAQIIAHAETRKRLMSPQIIAMTHGTSPAAPAAALPAVTFEQEQDVYFNGEHLHLTFIGPAHSDSDTCIHFLESNVMHAGDCWINGWYPLIDYSNGGSIEGYVKATDTMLKLSDSKTRFIPGHSSSKVQRIGSRDGMVEYHAMLATVCERVKKLKSEGRTLEEAVAAAPTADLDAQWGSGITNGKRFTELVYLSLA